MRRLHPEWGFDEIIQYNLRDNGTAVSIFAESQTDRVMKAREIIRTILGELGKERARIVEPACSAGDISGFFSTDHDVFACDVVPYAVQLSRERYPDMDVRHSAAEDLTPEPCDILVMCEFLEHIVDPIGFVEAWMPLAQYAVIGHPLVRDGWDPEEGHLWAYYPEDFDAWFTRGGHTMRQAWTFPMGYEMVIGWGKRDAV
jgi:hypothetical protein